ncbi:MAG: hypothetical protein RMM53_09220, partial [Bacteroidia bacterium]|nr:hypothetical protein [Bacteroidia bacterium]
MVFYLDQSAHVRFESITQGSCNWVYNRLYSGNVNSSGCNLTLYKDFATYGSGYAHTVCLPAGWYSLQSMGRLTPANDIYAFTCGNDLGKTLQIRIRAFLLYTEYDRNLSHPPAVDVINNGNPLVSGTTYTANLDVFDCDPSVMPPNVCPNGSNPAFDRAIYRQFVVNDYGTLDIHGTCHTIYRLYAGDALASPVSNG